MPQSQHSSPRLLMHAFGEYQTNCYILVFDSGELIIDPGMGATKWVCENCHNPIAICNTHGHFDHIWSNQELQSVYAGIPLIVHAGDAFMLREDCFGLNLPCSTPTHLVQNDGESLRFGEIEMRYWHFPGHTPGCCIIETDLGIFSGDFIFHRSIGRYDFPYSSESDMKQSLLRFQVWCNAKSERANKSIYPGHGASTTASEECQNIDFWLARMV